MAAAQAKQALLGLASTNLGVPVASLTVDKGVVSGGGKTVTYGQLVGDKLFNVKLHRHDADARAGSRRSRSASTRRSASLGRRAYDIPAIVNGTHTYAANVRVPGMCTAASSGRAARAPTATARTRCRCTIDASSIKHIPDVQIVHVGNFLGVVAPKEYDAIQAAAQLKVHVVGPAGDLRQRQPLEVRCATSTAPARRRPGSPAREPDERRRGDEVAPRRRTRTRSSTTTRCTPRSARTSRSPT